MRVSIFALTALLGSAVALDKIVIKDNKFFNSVTGDEFFFKGLAYQPENGEPDPNNRDPLADTVGCKRDIESFKDLGINAIRVYQTDYTKNHDVCMAALEKAGIYVVLDVPAPSYAINRAYPEWTTDLFAKFRAKVDNFSVYKNVAAYVIGNEVTNDDKTTPAAAFVKAAARDIKAYLKKQNITTPVGYASNDEPSIRDQLAAHFVCSENNSENVDFYGMNLYNWCGDMTFETSGYEEFVKQYASYPVPVLLTEYGCNAQRPRKFPEVGSLYGSDMDTVFSGGFMYEYSEEANNYGLASVTYGKTGVEKTDDYDNFKKALAAVSPKGVKMSEYKQSSAKRPSCPSVTDTWHVAPKILPPTPSSASCQCISSSFSCAIKGNVTDSDAGKAGDLIGNVCKDVSCSEIQTNTAKGEYGHYAFCDVSVRASYAVNAYYEDKKQCKADGFDTQTAKPSSKADSCADKTTDINTPSNNNGRVPTVDDSELEDLESGSSSGHRSSSGSSLGTSAAGSVSMLALASTQVAVVFAAAMLI
ncbi:hypothetical protein DL89DRAFT_320093 [Linderina pennispora]|uniref:1,3-beta-glucanosyltransferase n=1 Tax=Linderina pennispora TaxID=61395 RepID=A0A1Y1WNC9_9FUNG|nr:uncharacterized protein DL89DRAFT_320093 [Linderina pennispora]ORX74614.1 hypothetical protein DL89DRAFT_320093 [Linderina pennispora]